MERHADFISAGNVCDAKVANRGIPKWNRRNYD
jgi:hypothetical protein